MRRAKRPRLLKTIGSKCYLSGQTEDKVTKKCIKESWSTAEPCVKLHSGKAHGNKKELPLCRLTRGVF